MWGKINADVDIHDLLHKWFWGVLSVLARLYRLLLTIRSCTHEYINAAVFFQLGRTVDSAAWKWKLWLSVFYCCTPGAAEKKTGFEPGGCWTSDLTGARLRKPARWDEVIVLYPISHSRSLGSQIWGTSSYLCVSLSEENLNFISLGVISCGFL